MFRFTVRDVLWLTVVVALSVALWIEQRRFAAAQPWRTRTGALEQLLIDQGFKVEWNEESVNIGKAGKISGGARTDYWQPNVQ